MNENLKIYENTICSGLFNVLPKWSMRRRELKIGVGGGGESFGKCKATEVQCEFACMGHPICNECQEFLVCLD